MKNKIVQDMNMIWVLKKAIGITLFSCVMAACVFGKDAAISVTVSNPLVIDRPNEMIIIQWNEINKCLHNLKMETIHVFEAKTHKELCIQIIKENGEPTELLFLASFITHETKEFIIEFSTKERMATEPLTDARFMPRREDIAWENDRIAYRIYGPALAWELNNGFDVWTKRVRYPIVEKWYRLDEADTLHRISYHGKIMAKEQISSRPVVRWVMEAVPSSGMILCFSLEFFRLIRFSQQDRFGQCLKLHIIRFNSMAKAFLRRRELHLMQALI